jgi:hypothetical protein
MVGDRPAAGSVIEAIPEAPVHASPGYAADSNDAGKDAFCLSAERKDTM